MENVKLPDGRIELRPCPECHGAGYRVRVIGLRSA